VLHPTFLPGLGLRGVAREVVTEDLTRPRSTYPILSGQTKMSDQSPTTTAAGRPLFVCKVSCLFVQLYPSSLV
jgi:hypothetical protein